MGYVKSRVFYWALLESFHLRILDFRVFGFYWALPEELLLDPVVGVFIR